MEHLYRTSAAIGQFASAPIPSVQAASAAINWQEFLLDKLAWQDSDILSYRVTGGLGRVWLKRARPKRSAFLYGILNALATVMRLSWLKASSSAIGGVESSAVELRRLQELERAGVRVPHILAHTNGAILMQDAMVGADAENSVSLQHMIDSHFANGQPELALKYWQQGLYALLDVHRKNQYLSQAFSRNIVIGASGEIGFVDFEDDPLEVMDLLDCKVRDLLCYLHSTSWPIAQAGVVSQAQEILTQWMREYGATERKAFKQSLQRVRFVGKLPSNRRFGKDVVRVHYSYVLLSSAVQAV